MTINNENDIIKTLNECRKGEMNKSDSYYIAIVLRKYEKFLNLVLLKRFKAKNLQKHFDPKFVKVRKRVKIHNKNLDTHNYF